VGGAQVILDSKIIPISQLPDGITRDRLLSIVTDARATVCVVAVHDDDGWIVKVGYPAAWTVKDDSIAFVRPYCNLIHSPEQVADLGDGVSYAEAVLLFPHLPSSTAI
jgi:hypothetical protein